MHELPSRTPTIPKPHRRKHVKMNNRNMKLMFGAIAIALPPMTAAFTGGSIRSISESYYFTGPASMIFIGALFTIAAFLCAYNGRASGELGQHHQGWPT